MKRILLLIMVGFILTGTCLAEDEVMFNYQGRVKVQGTAFDGTGYFKFAIVNNAGNITLWSNDGTSAAGSEPTGQVSLTVEEGIFNVLIGDPALGMEPIPSTVLNHPNHIKLRIWFSDGTHGFQQMLPDRRIIHPDIIALQTGEEDFTIYINSATGNDDNSGLSPSAPKKTIQSAIDTLPERLRCNVTIDIADGTYREEVKIFGIFVEPGKSLTLLGDDSWDPTQPGDPAVRITGNDDDITSTRIRSNCIKAQQCSNLYIKGLLVDNGASQGMRLEEGSFKIYNCKSTEHAFHGFVVANNSTAFFYDCLAYQNDVCGFIGSTFTCIYFYDCQSLDNGQDGILLNRVCSGEFEGTGKFNNNGDMGVHVAHNSRARFGAYTGECRFNGDYGIKIHYDCYTEDDTDNDMSGNGLGTIMVGWGSNKYY